MILSAAKIFLILEEVCNGYVHQQISKSWLQIFIPLKISMHQFYFGKDFYYIAIRMSIFFKKSFGVDFLINYSCICINLE